MSLEEKIALQIVKLKEAARNLGETTITFYPQNLNNPEQSVYTTSSAVEAMNLMKMLVDLSKTNVCFDPDSLNKHIEKIEELNTKNPAIECRENIN